jgi:hypothetical protein
MDTLNYVVNCIFFYKLYPVLSVLFIERDV